MDRPPLHRILYAQVVFAIVCGILLGQFAPQSAVQMKPLGDGFIKLIKMLIAPIVFCTIVSGIAGMRDVKKVGRVGGKALLYFEVVSTFALALGLVVANALRPGSTSTSPRWTPRQPPSTRPGRTRRPRSNTC